MVLMEFNAASIISTALGQLSTDFGTVAPIAVGISLAAFSVRWLLKKGKSIAN